MKNSLKRSTKASKSIVKSKTGRIFLIILLVLLCYPVYSIIKLQSADADNFIQSFQSSLLSFWGVWIIMVSFAVYWKWTRQENILFYITYGYLLLAVVVLLLLVQDTPVGVEDNIGPAGEYPLMNNFLVLQHFLGMAFLTAFLQICVWWFTRRWHRR
ncbi:hypothetical protein RM553_13885 [Zunongwangia sp. F363]|uniref:Uncharacterized protein n=1 Tax=Autumnicola tepida TaxID=3075595 RepID=A0ABU3CC54_9FLAO|nr:hypothetical protein [Zunongwangia sp. F363]MDT0643924.1 hypothetical protein [Zunongwangia sp. F363]